MNAPPGYPTSLPELVAAIRTDQVELAGYLAHLCEVVEQHDRAVHALLPEPGRWSRLSREAEMLRRRYPDPHDRPPLYGVPVGIKDIFHVDGFPTYAGSKLPAEVLAGPQAACVTALREAGAMILGKTVTAEFAYLVPGPTRNPRNLQHTPGGSSSGSAAAVAAGFCPLALGTQTVGSVIRPAAFCGVVGFKPTAGRIPNTGLIASAPSLDQVGCFTADVAGAKLVAPILCADWQPGSAIAAPMLGVPDGPYLRQAAPEALEAFEAQLARIAAAGIAVLRVPALERIDAIAARHLRLVAGEMARVHRRWFGRFAADYQPRTAALIHEGQLIDDAELERVRAGQDELRDALAMLMARTGVTMWVSPSAPGPAPEGIGSTGNSAMNLPWTHAGLPVISLPAGQADSGLPLGLQCAGGAGDDARLLHWAALLEQALGAAGEQA